jgi:hypothetical protein
MDLRWIVGIAISLASGIILLAKFTDALSKLATLAPRIADYFRKTTIQVRLGGDRAAVRKALGEPDRERPGFDTFFSKGLAIFYGRDSKVDGIWASRMETGTEFIGKIEGISLGDTFHKCKRELGDPQEWGLPSSHFSLAVWTRDQDLLLLEIWRQRPTVGGYVDILPGTVKSIRLARKNSITVYEAVVAVAIEFIRQGQRPPQLEEHAIVDVDLDAPYFRQDYEIFGTAGHLGGGANVGVAFAGGQALAFWIYPLAGIQPAIRAIAPLKPKAAEGEMPPSQLAYER